MLSVHVHEIHEDGKSNGDGDDNGTPPMYGVTTNVPPTSGDPPALDDDTTPMMDGGDHGHSNDLKIGKHLELNHVYITKWWHLST